MNIKNNSGVTLTVLVITIIVMFILFGVTFSTATYLLKNTQKNKMKTMLYMVKSRGEILLEDYLFENDNEDATIRASNLKNVSKSDIEKSLGGTYITNLNDLKSVGYEKNLTRIPAKDQIIFCSWDESVLKSQGIDTKNLAQGDTIVVKYNIRENKVDVASTKGFSIRKGNAIHSLEDF